MPKRNTRSPLQAAFTKNEAHRPGINIQYQVARTDEPIHFSITFGPLGVAVMTDADLNEDTLFKGNTGSIENFSAGTGNSVRGKWLTINTTLSATSAMGATGNLLLDFRLEGGVKNFQQRLTQPFTAEERSALFSIEILFYS